MLPVNTTLPVALPAACGAKAIVKLELCPGVNVKGVASPLIENAAPAAVALVIVTELPPEFIIVTGWFWVVPSVTLPKLTLLGFSASAPDATAVPVTATLRFALLAVDVTVRPPLTVPGDVGEKLN
jgi:hypothetical protein